MFRNYFHDDPSARNSLLAAPTRRSLHRDRPERNSRQGCFLLFSQANPGAPSSPLGPGLHPPRMLVARSSGHSGMVRTARSGSVRGCPALLSRASPERDPNAIALSPLDTRGSKRVIYPDMKTLLLALTFWTVSATAQVSDLPLLREGQWTSSTLATRALSLQASLYSDDYCDWLSDSCNRVCDQCCRSSLDCYMSCMDAGGCPVGLAQTRIPRRPGPSQAERLRSSYSSQASR